MDVLVLPLDPKLLFTGLKGIKVAAFAEHGEQWLLKVPAMCLMQNRRALEKLTLDVWHVFLQIVVTSPVPTLMLKL